ncbi:hypothetical protein [Pedobacter gandavensis]|uniref:hypothetical protein n=1 Tax=Pedobacter gandavensis TaxID=2679963 RepID=UPI00292F09D1|nr:hypothetical protein [Pedobacter gandavensis]
MNLEELKGEWVAHHDKINHTSPLKPELIAGIIRKKSETISSKIRKFYVHGALFCSFYIVAISLLGWLSDEMEFLNCPSILPLSFLFLAIFVFGLGLLLMRKIDSEQNVLNYLERVASHYVLALRMVIGLAVVALGILLIVLPSFKLSENIGEHGLLWGILDTYELFIVGFIIQWLGRFIPQAYLWSKKEDRYSLRQLKLELKELRELTDELRVGLL